MRIVQIANFYGPRSGGLRTAVDHLGAGYVRRGHEVTLVVPGPAADRDVLPSGVVKVTVAAPRIPFTGGYRAARLSVVVGVTEGLCPDVIEVSDRLTLRGMGRWARRHGVGSVMISHERLDRLLGQILPQAISQMVADKANHATARNYDTVVCTTAFAAEEFDRIGVKNRCRVPLGVDLEVFHPREFDAARRARLLCGSEYLLVHCGRLSVEKHVHRSIDALARLRGHGIDARLVIVGDGPYRAKLERRAVGLPVEFIGFVRARADVATILACADVALAPGPHETFGLAALEALASGTAVVVSGSSALSEIITARCGAAAPDTADGLARAIASVLDMTASTRVTESRRRAEEFGGHTLLTDCSRSSPRLSTQTPGRGPASARNHAGRRRHHVPKVSRAVWSQYPQDQFDGAFEGAAP